MALRNKAHDAAGNLTETDRDDEGTAADATLRSAYSAEVPSATKAGSSLRSTSERDYTYDYRNRLVKVEDRTGRGADLACLRRHERTGRPLGSEDFLLRFERFTGRRLRRGRPGPKPRHGGPGPKDK